MLASVKNILIGLFVFTAIGIIIFMILFLHPSVGDNAKTLHVRFTDVDKVNVGTRVTFAGKPVGEVIAIQELPSARTSRLSKNGEIYVYELTLKVDSGVDVFNTDQVLLRTSGLLGERNIEISPRPLHPGQKLLNVEDQILYAKQTVSVEDTMRQIGEISDKFGIILDDFHQTMADIQREDIVTKVGVSAQNMIELTSAFDQPDKINKMIENALSFTESLNQIGTTLNETSNDFHELSQKAKVSWNTVDETLNEFHTSAHHVVSFTEKADQLMTYTSQGHGTLGQFFVGDDLYLRLKSILHKGESTFNDINSYGLAFHLDKRWQRQQARRLRLLEKLSSPCEFAHYFNKEMDQISSSLSHVSMILNESECYPQSLIYNSDFTKRFAELLKKVEIMEESLKMYNEQVIDQE